MAIPVIAGVLMKVAGPIIVAKLGKKLSKPETDAISAEVVQQIVEQVTADPVVKNELNAEAPWQSRVAVGASAIIGTELLMQIGAISDAFDTLAPIATGVLNLVGVEVATPAPGRLAEIAQAVATFYFAGYVLYGRFKSGLRPLFAK